MTQTKEEFDKEVEGKVNRLPFYFVVVSQIFVFAVWTYGWKNEKPIHVTMLLWPILVILFAWMEIETRKMLDSMTKLCSMSTRLIKIATSTMNQATDIIKDLKKEEGTDEIRKDIH